MKYYTKDVILEGTPEEIAMFINMVKQIEKHPEDYTIFQVFLNTIRDKGVKDE